MESGTPPKILIVDDEPFNVDYLEQELEDLDYAAVAATNGQEALDMVKTESPDLILLDIMMPVMDGFEVLSILKKQSDTRDIPVIIVSAMTDMDSVIKGIEMGAEDYLSKPFDPILLRARLSASLEKKQFRDIEKQYLAILEAEQLRSESLLLNILPSAIAERLKTNPGTIADYFEEATILFADLVGFTEYSSGLDAARLVEELNRIISIFDQLAQQHNMEKIKTMGDSYMAAAGIPLPQENHVELAADMALDMIDAITDLQERDNLDFHIRIGIHCGPLVAGVIGEKKYAYDVWGDTVNTASRMESHGIPGVVHVSTEVYERLKDRYRLDPRGHVEIKGKGEMKTYCLLGKK